MISVPEASKRTDDMMLTKGNEQFMSDWMIENQKTFCECMNKLAEEKPDKFCELYLKVNTTQAMTRKAEITNNQYNIRVGKDINQLQKLASKIKVKDGNEYADFEDADDKERNNHKEFSIF